MLCIDVTELDVLYSIWCLQLPLHLWYRPHKNTTAFRTLSPLSGLHHHTISHNMTDFWQDAWIFGAPIAVQSNALVVGSRRIMVLHGKQKPFSKDIKSKYSLHFKAAIPRVCMHLDSCWFCCVEKNVRCPATQRRTLHCLDYTIGGRALGDQTDRNTSWGLQVWRISPSLQPRWEYWPRGSWNVSRY